MAGLHTAGRLVTHLSTTQQDALQHALHTHGYVNTTPRLTCDNKG
jgi:hypothetical protein